MSRTNPPAQTRGRGSGPNRASSKARNGGRQGGGFPAGSPEVQGLRRAADACNAAFAYCMQDSDDVDLDLVSCIVDCAELCGTTAAFIVRGSEHADDLRKVCAGVAKCVEEACEQFPDDEAFAACADACRDAYAAMSTQSSPRVG